MASRIQIRRDFSSNWVLNNPILTEGELGYELDTKKLKVGDGIKAWNSLNYFQETVNYTDVVDPPKNLSYFTDDVGYVLETSPAGGITNANINNWNTAYGWGNHALSGYLTTANAATTYLSITNAASGYQAKDADLTAIAALAGTNGLLKKTSVNTWVLDTTTYLTTADAAAGVNPQDLANWNAAYSWGNHASAGYLTVANAQVQYQPYDSALTAISDITSPSGLLRKTSPDTWALDTNAYLTVETDPIFSASPASGITNNAITNWNTAYSWGDHSTAGYLLSSTASTTYQSKDADLTAIAALAGTNGLLKKTSVNTWVLDTTEYLNSTSPASSITNANINNWNTAYNWGNHATAGYLLSNLAASTYQPIDQDLTAISAISTNGFLKRTGPGAWAVDNNVYLTTTDAANNYQPADADLTAIAGLSGTGMLRKTGTNTWSLDTGSFVKTAAAPVTSTSTGTTGTIAYDADFLYVCVDTDTWKRVALQSW
jgi:hypothetical protein